MNPSEPNPESSLLPVVVRPHDPPGLSPKAGLWPERVQGPSLLDQVADTYRQYLVLPPGAPDALALIVAHFHCYAAFLHTPRLSFQAMEKGCAKTTSLEVTASLSPGPFMVENMSTAVLFRVAALRGVTLFLDEVDTWLHHNEAMRGILNAGHRYGGQVSRCDGLRGAIRCYNVFAPVALAGIGSLPETLQDRSIVIRLTRAKRGEIKASFDPRRTEAEDQLRAKLARWTWENFTRLEGWKPVLPKQAQNRLADNWRPLFAIAEVAGGNWPLRAAEAFWLLNQDRLAGDEQSIRIKLLRDIRAVFDAGHAIRLPSAVLALELAKLEGQPWVEFRGRRAISTNQLAHLLRGFGIRPRTMRFGETMAKGYAVTDFKDVFERFLPQP